MLITVELLLADNPRRSLLTIGEMDISSLPGVEAVTECYTERFATIPPGMWYRYYQGRRWRTRSIPGPAFFCFSAAGGIYRKSDAFWKATVGLFSRRVSPLRKYYATSGYISLKRRRQNDTSGQDESDTILQ